MKRLLGLIIILGLGEHLLDRMTDTQEVNHLFEIFVSFNNIHDPAIRYSHQSQQPYSNFPHGNTTAFKVVITHPLDMEAKIVRLFKNKKRYSEPLTIWPCCYSGYALLDDIFQKITGITYAQAVTKYIFDPLQARPSSLDSTRRASGITTK